MDIQMRMQRWNESGELITVDIDSSVVHAVLVAVNAIADEHKNNQPEIDYEELVKQVRDRSGAPEDIVRILLLDLPYLHRSVEKIQSVLRL